MKKISFLLLALQLLYFCAAAQTFYFRHYQTENGLSHNSVFNILQDKKGFMWFGTRDGLDRFDGYTFKVFRYDPSTPGSIGSNFIYSLYQDSHNQMWVGTSKGLFRYDELTESFIPLKYTLNHGVGLVREDGRGNYWFIQDQTLIRYEPSAERYTAYPRAKYFESTALCVDKNQELWVSTADGYLQKYNYANNTFTAYSLFNHSDFTTSHDISCLYDTGLGSLLVGTTNQGVKLFDLATGTYRDLLTRNTDKTELYIRDFVKSNDGQFWIATESGVYIYNINTGLFTNLKKDLTNPFALSDNAVYSLCRDREGGLWAGTYFGGANYFNPQYSNFERFISDGNPAGLKGNIVREICQYKNNLWIGTEDAGLNAMNITTGQFRHFAPDGLPGSISYTNIHGLLVDHDELWIGTYEHGLDIMNLQTEKVVRHYIAGPGTHQLKSNFIITLCRTHSGDILIGTSIGMYIYNRATNSFDLFSAVPAKSFVYGILEAADGQIWIATLGGGLFRYDPKNHQTVHFTYKPNDSTGISSNALTSIFEDRGKNIWITTEDGGLNEFQAATQTFRRFTVKDGFPSNFLFKIMEDDYGRLWITSTKGLICFHPDTHKLAVFTQANGLLSDQFNYNSAYKDSKGRLYFGCIKGLIRFNPYEFKHQNYQPGVYITGLQIDNQDIAAGQPGSPLKRSIVATDQVVLQPGQNSISLDFAALSYTAPQMTGYAYKMDGLDNHWTYLKTNRKVYFTKLPPGTYTFQVRTLNDAGTEAKNAATLQIVVLPPFYASIWAYLLYAILLIVIGNIILRRYHKRTQEKNQRRIELLENEMSKEIYQAKIEFFTNITHEIRTPLTLIKAPLEKVAASHDPELIKEYVALMQKNTDRLLTLTDQLLDFRKTEIKGFRLNFVRATVKSIVKEVYQSFQPAAEQRQLNYNLHLPANELFAYLDIEAFHKILDNLIGNAVKYAAGYIDIILEEHGPDFTVTIKNDGQPIEQHMREKIFEPFFRINERAKQPGTGIGLSLARSLAELHNGNIALETGEPGTNIFTLTLPVHQEIEFDLFEEPAETVQLADGKSAAVVKDLPLLLLAEDNRDIGKFIAQELSDAYEVVHVLNGDDALKVLQSRVVDFIISDIMMPVMDGLQLCSLVKTNIDYSHIPVILLTAKNTLESKIEGLEVGADAYIEKPFSPEHLRVQIANILRNRQSLHDHFSHSPLAHIKSIAYSKADEQFLEALNDAILAELNNMHFDVDQLADKMCLGRRTLFRKIKAISKLTPNEMINLTRLKKAAELLATGDYRIYEVADQVGFSSSTVFTRAFQKQFNLTPSEYMALKPHQRDSAFSE